jgi:hypothetical protein
MNNLLTPRDPLLKRPEFSKHGGQIIEIGLEITRGDLLVWPILASLLAGLRRATRVVSRWHFDWESAGKAAFKFF